MINLERRPDRSHRGGINIERYKSQIARNRDRVKDIVAPHTFSGRLRSFVVSRIPFTPLRTALEQAPLEGAIHEMRGPIIDLYNNMGDIIREGRSLVEFHSDVRELLDETIAHPDDQEALRQLRDKLREKAEKDLNIQRDPDTEELLEQVLEPEDPERRAAIREKTIFEAQEVLAVSQTIAHIGENIATNTAQTFETMNSQYALLLDIRQAVNVLHRSGSDIIKAHDMKIQAFNTLTGQIDVLLVTAKLATEVQQLASEAQVTVDAEKIKVLRERAESLDSETARLLPSKAGKNNKESETPPLQA